MLEDRLTIDAKNGWIQWRRVWKSELDDVVARTLQQLSRPTIIFHQLLLRLILLLLSRQGLLLHFFLNASFTFFISLQKLTNNKTCSYYYIYTIKLLILTLGGANDGGGAFLTCPDRHRAVLQLWQTTSQMLDAALINDNTPC